MYKVIASSSVGNQYGFENVLINLKDSNFKKSFFTHSDESRKKDLDSVLSTDLMLYAIRKQRYLNFLKSIEFKGMNISPILVNEDVGGIYKESLPSLLTIALILDDKPQINIIKDYLEGVTVENSALYSFDDARQIIDALKNRGYSVGTLREKGILMSLYKSVRSKFEKVCLKLYCNDPTTIKLTHIPTSDFDQHKTLTDEKALKAEDINQLAVALKDNTCLKTLNIKVGCSFDSLATPNQLINALQSTQIESLSLSGLPFSEESSKVILGLDSLKILSLKDKAITDNSFSNLLDLIKDKGLISLSINSDSLTHKIINSKNLESLKKINCGFNIEIHAFPTVDYLRIKDKETYKSSYNNGSNYSYFRFTFVRKKEHQGVLTLWSKLTSSNKKSLEIKLGDDYKAIEKNIESLEELTYCLVTLNLKAKDQKEIRIVDLKVKSEENLKEELQLVREMTFSYLKVVISEKKIKKRFQLNMNKKFLKNKVESSLG